MGVKFTACELYEGESFGELALANSEPRAATIISIQPCEFLVIEKDDYNVILRRLHEKQTKTKLQILQVRLVGTSSIIVV